MTIIEATKPKQSGSSTGGTAPIPSATSKQGRISIKNVTKKYDGTEVLSDVSLEIEPGKVTVLLGPSGSGKSTLLRTINHLEAVDQGTITIDGEYIGYERRGDRLYELPEREVLKNRVNIGLVFQNFNLFPHLTVLQNIVEAPLAHKQLGKSAARQLALELLAKVGLGDKADAYPRNLSGGQQQRVAIARALALKPKVLLFDEPTSALDPELVGEVLQVIKELAHEQRTLVIVTHEIGFAREIADQVVFLENGRILAQGTPDEVIDHPVHPRLKEFFSKVLAGPEYVI